MIDFTKSNRDKSTLNALALKAYNLFIDECKKENIDIFPTDFLRTKERQWFLYCKGRTVSQSVSGGVPEYFAKEWSRPNEGKVTWTLNSNHKTGMAWDMAVNPPKDLYDVTVLTKAGNIAKKLGIEWGGSWKQKDTPHFQISNDWREPIMEEVKVVIPQWKKDMCYAAISKLSLDASWKQRVDNDDVALVDTLILMNRLMEKINEPTFKG